jgi:hypothetical protein
MSKQQSINEKLFALQQEIGAISKDANNPFYKSKYFDINSLLKQLQPLLKKHKLLLIQPIEEDMVYSKILCIEGTGGVISGLKLPELNDPQKLGSAITYYRRYTLQSLLALQAEDDDGNVASGKTSTAIPNDRKWLNQNTPEYTKAIEYLQGGGTMDSIKAKYKVSKKVQDELAKV